MSTFMRLSISELGFDAGTVVDLTDEPKDAEPRDSGWYPNQVFQIGEYELTEWRSDRNHLDLEIQFDLGKAGVDFQTPQLILLIVYRAMMEG